MTLKEFTGQVYDTLMENVGMSEHHVKFDPSTVTNQECDDRHGHIVMEIDGTVFSIQIDVLMDRHYFDRDA